MGLVIREILKEDYGSLDPIILNEVVGVGQGAFCSTMTKQRVIDNVMGSDRLYLAIFESSVVGFALTSMDKDYVDFLGAAIHPGFQGGDVYKRLSQVRFDFALSIKTPGVVTTTQNPRVERGLRKNLQDLVDSSQIVGYNIGREILPGFYGVLLTEKRQFSGTNEVDFEYNKLDYEAGDAFKLVFQMCY